MVGFPSLFYCEVVLYVFVGLFFHPAMVTSSVWYANIGVETEVRESENLLTNPAKFLSGDSFRLSGASTKFKRLNMLFDIKTLLGVFLLSLATCLSANAFEASVTSPEGAVVIGFALT